MNKIIVGIVLVGLTSLMAGSYKVGNTYINDDGSSTYKVGNTYIHSDGSSSYQSGNTDLSTLNRTFFKYLTHLVHLVTSFFQSQLVTNNCYLSVTFGDCKKLQYIQI